MAESETLNVVQVPEGKRLVVKRKGKPLFFVEAGQSVDTQRLPKDSEYELLDTPVRPDPSPRNIRVFDDLTRGEKLRGLFETLAESQKTQIVEAVKNRMKGRT